MVRKNYGPETARGQAIFARTYSRPKDDGSFETYGETIDRVIRHQRWLWERARGSRSLHPGGTRELEALMKLLLERKVGVSGRTMWLGGTEVAKEREATQFNCSFLVIESIQDVVDLYWLLLQGVGPGFSGRPGVLSGFSRPVELKIIRSTKTVPGDKGRENNVETFDGGDWHISVGDSAEAWAKLPGKLLANKRMSRTLTIDFSEVRPAGSRLSRYGWISSGDEVIVKAIGRIVELLNHRADMLLTRLDIMDLCNLLATTLSSRRAAEMFMMDADDHEAGKLADAKADLSRTPWRSQSNNTLVYWAHPSVERLTEHLKTMVANGGSEPGILNGAEAKRRAPWFAGVNPCGGYFASH